MYIIERDLFAKETKCLEVLEDFRKAHADVFSSKEKMTSMNAIISKLGTSITHMGMIPALCYFDRNRSENKASSYAYVLELLQKILGLEDETSFTKNWLDMNGKTLNKDELLLANIALKRTFRTYDFEPKENGENKHE